MMFGSITACDLDVNDHIQTVIITIQTKSEMVAIVPLTDNNLPMKFVSIIPHDLDMNDCVQTMIIHDRSYPEKNQNIVLGH